MQSLDSVQKFSIGLENVGGSFKKFKGDLQVEHLEISNLLQRWKLANCLAEYPFSGASGLEISADERNEWTIEGQAKFTSPELKVRRDFKKPYAFDNHVLHLGPSNISGAFNINKNRVSIKDVLVKQGKSSARLSGSLPFDISKMVIDLGETFLSLDEDILNIAHTDLRGTASLTGRFWLNGNKDLQGKYAVSAKNFKIDTFDFGDIQGIVENKDNYTLKAYGLKKSQIKIDTASFFEANLNTDLWKLKLDLAKAPSQELSPIISGLVPYLYFDFGSVSGKADFNGSFAKKTFQGGVDLNISNFSYLHENFDNLNLKSLLNDSHFYLKNFDLQKDAGNFYLKEAGLKFNSEKNPSEKLEQEYTIVSKNFRIESLSLLKKIRIPLEGNGDIRITTNNVFKHHYAQINLKMPGIYFGNNDLNGLELDIRKSPEKVFGSINFGSRKIFLGGYYNFLGDRYKLQGYSRKSDFSFLLKWLSGFNYESNISSQVNGQFSVAGKWGQPIENCFVNFEDLKIRDNNDYFSLQKSQTFRIENGKITPIQLNFAGNNSLIDASVSSNSQNSPQIALKGRLNLRIVKYFLPFLKDLSGSIKMSLLYSPSFEQMKLEGMAYIEKASATIRAFERKMSQIDLILGFKSNTIEVQSFSSVFANAWLSGSGLIKIFSNKWPELALKFKTVSSRFTFPLWQQSGLKGEFAVLGNRLPYMIRGKAVFKDTKIDLQKLIELNSNFLEETKASRGTIANSKTQLFELDIENAITEKVVIENPFIRMDAMGTFKFSGYLSDPKIFGNLDIVGGTLTFNKDFNIKDGKINFHGSLVPDVLVNAVSKEKIDNFDAFIKITYPPLITVFQSEPSLPKNKIYNLIYYGKSEIDSNFGVNNSASATMDLVVDSLNKLVFGNLIKDITSIDVQLKGSSSQKIRQTVNPGASNSLDLTDLSVQARKKIFGVDLSWFRRLGRIDQNVNAQIDLGNNISLVGSYSEILDSLGYQNAVGFSVHFRRAF